MPAFVFYPVFIVLFGLNRWPLVAIGFVFAVTAVIINTLDGLSRVPRGVRAHSGGDAADAGAAISLHIMLPAAAPWLFTGAKFAVVVFLHRCDRGRVRTVGRRNGSRHRLRLQLVRQSRRCMA